MPRLCDIVNAKVENFVGIKYTSGDLEQIIAKSEGSHTIFIGCDSILMGSLAVGFDCSIMTTLNLCPELAHAISSNVKSLNMSQARVYQNQLNKVTKKILYEGKERIFLKLNLFFYIYFVFRKW